MNNDQWTWGVELSEWKEIVDAEELYVDLSKDPNTQAPPKKMVSLMRENLMAKIEEELTSARGYEFRTTVVYQEDLDDNEIVLQHKVWAVRKGLTEYITGHWVDNDKFDLEIGRDLSWDEFIQEEAKRKIRDMFPGHERFITWACHN